MTSIVERLRAWAECGPNDLPEAASADLFVAADEITRLTAEVESLRALAATCNCGGIDDGNHFSDCPYLLSMESPRRAIENAALTARVKELEEALLKVTDALNKGRIVPRRVVSGVGIEILYEYTDVPVGPIEDAIEILYEDRAALTQPTAMEKT